METQTLLGVEQEANLIRFWKLVYLYLGLSLCGEWVWGDRLSWVKSEMSLIDRFWCQSPTLVSVLKALGFLKGLFMASRSRSLWASIWRLYPPVILVYLSACWSAASGRAFTTYSVWWIAAGSYSYTMVDCNPLETRSINYLFFSKIT